MQTTFLCVIIIAICDISFPIPSLSIPVFCRNEKLFKYFSHINATPHPTNAMPLIQKFLQVSFLPPIVPLTLLKSELIHTIHSLCVCG